MQLKDGYGGGQRTKIKAMKLLENLDEFLLQMNLAYVEMQLSLQKWLREGCRYSVVFLERRTQVLRWPSTARTGDWQMKEASSRTLLLAISLTGLFLGIPLQVLCPIQIYRSTKSG